MQPTLLIGLGGTGAYVIADTLAKLLETPATTERLATQFSSCTLTLIRTFPKT